MGTPQELTDDDGNVVWYNYEWAWGGRYTHHYTTQSLNGCAIIESDLQPIRFQGQSLDIETGLHYNRFRYYDSDVGMFISRDPIGLLGGNNVFAYAPNPVGWVDPLGLNPCKGLPSSRKKGGTGKHYDKLSKAEAKFLEQKLMGRFGGAKSANPNTTLSNEIRSYSRKTNPNASTYNKAGHSKSWGKQILRDAFKQLQ